MHLFVQQQQAAAAAQVQYAQQAAAYGHSPQYGAQQGYAGAGMHEEGPLFFRDPPPPVPVAIDARGRPFKVIPAAPGLPACQPAAFCSLQ